METIKIPIRNKSLPESPRVFDVTVDISNKTIIRYDIQNIRGRLFIENDEVQQQIDEAFEENNY